MEHSEQINDFAAAFAKAQAKVEGAVKGKVNPAFKSKYADLSAVWDACRNALTENGLSVIQAPGPLADNRLTLTTMLLHSSGQWARETMTMPIAKLDPQGYGSAVTYARRYALAAFVGVSPEDDDGNAATHGRANGAANGGAEPSGGAGDDTVTRAQVDELLALCKAKGRDPDAFTKHLGLESLFELRTARFADAKAILERARSQPVREAA